MTEADRTQEAVPLMYRRQAASQSTKSSAVTETYKSSSWSTYGHYR